MGFVKNHQIIALLESVPVQVKSEAFRLLLEVEVKATHHLGKRRLPALAWADECDGRVMVESMLDQRSNLSPDHLFVL
jgi:hypothetical protein